MRPVQNLPATRTRDPPQTPRGIHGKSVANFGEHPAVQRRVAVSAAACQRNILCARKLFRRERFFFAEDRRACHSAGPAPVYDFQLRCDDKYFAVHTAPQKFALERELHNLRKRRESSTNQNDVIPAQRMPPNTLNRCRKKLRQPLSCSFTAAICAAPSCIRKSCVGRSRVGRIVSRRTCVASMCVGRICARRNLRMHATQITFVSLRYSAQLARIMQTEP